jgi:hypothetical protein
VSLSELLENAHGVATVSLAFGNDKVSTYMPLPMPLHTIFCNCFLYVLI